MNNHGGIAFFGNANMPISTYIRFLNTIKGIRDVSLYIDGQRCFEDVKYGSFTGYTSIPPGINSLSLYQAGDYGKPIMQVTEAFSVGNSITLAATGTQGNIKIFQIPEPYSAPAAIMRSSLRMVNLSREGLTLDGWIDENTKIFSDVKYTELTPYTRLQANVYTVTATDSDTGEQVAVAKNLYLDPGKIYSLYIVPDNTEEEKFMALFATDGEITDSDK